MMTTTIDSGQSGPVVAELIAMLGEASRGCEIELIADQLAVTGNRCAIRPLLTRLGDSQVQEDADVEDAVCGALVALGVMSSSGNRSFAFRPRHLLSADAADAVRALGPAIPVRYLLARGI